MYAHDATAVARCYLFLSASTLFSTLLCRQLLNFEKTIKGLLSIVFEFYVGDFGETANEISWIAPGRIETRIRMNANEQFFDSLLRLFLILACFSSLLMSNVSIFVYLSLCGSIVG